MRSEDPKKLKTGIVHSMDNFYWRDATWEAMKKKHFTCNKMVPHEVFKLVWMPLAMIEHHIMWDTQFLQRHAPLIKCQILLQWRRKVWTKWVLVAHSGPWNCIARELWAPLVRGDCCGYGSLCECLNLDIKSTICKAVFYWHHFQTWLEANEMFVRCIMFSSNIKLPFESLKKEISPTWHRSSSPLLTFVTRTSVKIACVKEYCAPPQKNSRNALVCASVFNEFTS